MRSGEGTMGFLGRLAVRRMDRGAQSGVSVSYAHAPETKPGLRTHTPASKFHRGPLQIVSVKRLHRDVDPIATNPVVRDDPEKYRIPCALFTASVGEAVSAIEYLLSQADWLRFRQAANAMPMVPKPSNVRLPGSGTAFRS